MKFLLALSLKIKIIIISCVTAAAVTVTAVVVINSEDAYRVIKVFELDGEAVVARENTGELEAYEGMNLESGDILYVDVGSTMRLSLDGDKYILLDGGTVMKLIAQGTAADSKTSIDLQKGTILNEINNALSANSSYEVNTPKATMAVRGTIFSVTAEETEDGNFITDVCTTEGKVSVQLFDESGNKKGEEVLVPAGNKVTILTEANSKTGNAPSVDGDPHFVFKSGSGEITDCGEADPVYPINEAAAANAQTAETESSSAPTETESTQSTQSTKDTEASSYTELPVTKAAVYEPVVTAAEVSEAPAVTEVPAESSAEPETVIPSEISSAAETTEAASETTAAATLESTAASTETETSPPTVSETTVPTRFYPIITPPVQTYPTYTAPAPFFPTGTAPTALITESVSSSDVTDVSESTETSTETTAAAPVRHMVSFIDENGNVVSTSEYGDSETAGVLPEISAKRGYTGKWVCGGSEVTENTVISSDMEITAQYTPKPVRVEISAPHSGDPQNTYGTVLEFTVPYDGKLTDNAEGYNIENLTAYVKNLYADYIARHGGTVNLEYVHSVSQSGDDIVTNDYIITGDHVFDESGGLSASVSFQLSYTR